MSIRILAIRAMARAIATPSLSTTTRGMPERIRRRELPYWQERGWRRDGDTYVGTYQTPYGSFRGLIEDRGWGYLRFYMLEPPLAVQNSGHWACFQPRGRKGYHVHMARKPGDISSGILSIERLITEAHGG